MEIKSFIIYIVHVFPKVTPYTHVHESLYRVSQGPLKKKIKEITDKHILGRKKQWLEDTLRADTHDKACFTSFKTWNLCHTLCTYMYFTRSCQPHNSTLQNRALLYFPIHNVSFRLVRQALSCVPALSASESYSNWSVLFLHRITFHTSVWKLSFTLGFASYSNTFPKFNGTVMNGLFFETGLFSSKS
jgi:hypothetical protein